MNLDKFLQQIMFDGSRYQVSLPWKGIHPSLTNFELCVKRLNSLLRRLRSEPTLLSEYNEIIHNQIKDGIVEVVPDQEISGNAQVHYLPHYGVVR
jgi:hypothetical protein